MYAAQVLFLLFVAFDSVKVPPDPGLYYATAAGPERIEGHSVTVDRAGSKLPPIPMRGMMPLGGSKIRAEILGEHADSEVISTPVFYYRTAKEDAAGAADLVLVKLKAKHGRRGFEVSAKSDWTAGSGISLNSQVRFNGKRVETGVYKLVPAEDLDRGEYGFYQYRGHEMPGLLYDFSVE